MSDAFMRETDIQRECTVLLQSVGAYVLRTNQPRASFVSAGLPDLICFLPRRKGILLVECKKRGAKQSDIQILVGAKAAQAGVPLVVGGPEEVRTALEIVGLIGGGPKRPVEKECPCIVAEKAICGSPKCFHFAAGIGYCETCGNSGTVK